MPSTLAAALNGRLIGRSKRSSGVVQLWDLQTCQLRSEFDTVLENGGSRLAVSPAGDRVLAGAFTRHGVALYDAASGERLWQNRSVKNLQELHFTYSGTHAWCIADVGAARMLDLQSGDVVLRMRAIRWMRPSLLDSRAAWFDGNRLCLGGQDGTRVADLAVRPARPLIDSAFGRESLWVSESGGPLRCIDLVTRELVVQLQSGAGWHWTLIGHRKLDEAF